MKFICESYCPYFREDKEDIGHCYPVILAKYMNTHILLDMSYTFENKFFLEDFLCADCDFYKEDCDFHNENNRGLPCGGYMYFEHLLKEGKVSIDDIRRLCKVKR